MHPTITEEKFRKYSDLCIVIASTVPRLDTLMEASMRVRIVLIVGVLAFTAVRLGAHDFWLAATPWQPESRVTITANIGEIAPST